LTFQILLSRLRELLKEKVKNGQLTERGMARLTGTSQPHLHNILKGIRTLPPELADQLLPLAGLSLIELMGSHPPGESPPVTNGRLGESVGRHAVPERLSDDGLEDLSALHLPLDPRMEPRFQSGDIIYYQESSRDRTDLNTTSAYLVVHNGRLLARYIRWGGKRLYLVSEDSLNDPVRWDYVSLVDRHILEIVRGRIVWIRRKVEAIEAGTAQEARRDDRRAG
jgi:hypothetical protein